MEEKYALYVLTYQIPSEDFWHLPLHTLEGILLSKQAYDSWKQSPRKTGDAISLDKDFKQRAASKLTNKGGGTGGRQEHECGD